MKYVAELPEGARLSRVLIANRGEIAQRIISTCDRLNIDTISLYTRQDQSAKFWKLATVNHYAGDIENDGNPYTNAARLVEIARQYGADAVHPGYGYLSENADFARQVVAAGLLWIGPKAETIALLGDKAACKQFLRDRTGGAVPLIPGVASRSQDSNFLLRESRRIGYPVLLKASAGGGGKGMRVVDTDEDFLSNLETAKSEALRSFGSDDMLLEKYLPRCKHVEVQMFGDGQGNSLLFGDRECSVQRRHQKVIEECPAMVSSKLKEKMAEAARSIAKVTKYANAATIEFIVDVVSQEAYFLEVNTRIQVEHPITEEVFGVDLVALQLYIAAGGKLSSLPDFNIKAHAIELRLYAEDPYHNFMPQKGLVTMFQESTLGVRYESSVQTGDRVSINFDPMMAKIIVAGFNRPMAIAKAQAAIGSTVCLGLQTNQDFLFRCLTEKTFKDASYTTSFIEENLDNLLQRRNDMTIGVFIISALLRAIRSKDSRSTRLPSISMELITTPTKSQYLVRKVRQEVDHLRSYKLELSILHDLPDTVPKSALNAEGFKLVSRYYATKTSPPSFTTAIELTDFGTKESSLGTIVVARLRIGESSQTVVATVHQSADGVQVVHLDRYGTFVRKSGLVGFGQLDDRQSLSQAGAADYKAPMPGRVIRIDVLSGSVIKPGQSLLVLESMKTEVRILARTAGTVELLVKEGAIVDEGVPLATVKEPEL